MNTSSIDSILNSFDKISLEDMKSVKLMNRTDTKYVCSMPKFLALLRLIQDKYMVQEISGRMLMPYYTRYYDTESCEMYCHHLHGKKTRKKIRVRRYVSSGTEFLEIKRKNNKGRTDKKRVETEGLLDSDRTEFVMNHSGYEMSGLTHKIENEFSRLTFVNRRMTERVTIDICLNFHNLISGNDKTLDNVAIIELKRDSRASSDLQTVLKQLRIKPSGFSKYCIGMAMTDCNLPQNRFKERIRMINKLNN